MATSMHLAWKHCNNTQRLLQATLNHIYGSTHHRCCHMAAQAITPTQAKLMRKKRDIKIPKKKKRDSLSVLRALSEVTGKNHLVPDYQPMFTDDPFLLPYNQHSVTHRLPLISGKVSAQYFIQRFPECFAFEKSVPHIPAFEPIQGEAKVEEVSEEALQERIQLNLLSDAVQLYEEIIGNGGSVSVNTVEDLVEMVMYYFGSDHDKITDHPFHKQLNLSKELNKPKPIEAVDKFISSLNVEKTPRMYKAIILGCCKHEHMETAMGYYKEMKARGFQCDRDIFHALLSETPPRSDSEPLPFDTAMDLIRDMKTAGITPTEETFSRLGSGPGLRCPDFPCITKIFSEIKALEMKPSLSMCRALLNFTRTHRDLQAILSYIDKENIKATSEQEMRFFIDAIQLCDSSLKNPQLAFEVDRLFRTLGEGHYFLTTGESRNYYRPLLCAFIFNDTVENTMEMYDKVVPCKISPKDLPLHALFKQFKGQRNFQYVPKLFKDLYINIKQLDDSRVQLALELIDTINDPPELLQDLCSVFDIVKKDKFERTVKSRRKIMRADMRYLEVASKINLKTGSFEEAWEYFEKGAENIGFTKSYCVKIRQCCVDRGEDKKTEMVKTYIKNYI